jgi:predicted 3-demethylubiquinone-9 3-methyltransferase (glyoxalase superfamily)
MQKITPFLWFDNLAEDAVTLYTTLFRKSKILSISYYDEAGAKATGMPKGSVMSISFTLNGQNFIALNGGPVFNFTPAVSFMVTCKDQREIDKYWDRLTRFGGQEGQCGWLKDRFGLSWQIVPVTLDKMLNDPDPEKAARVMQAMLKMKKIDLAELKKARSIKLFSRKV